MYGIVKVSLFCSDPDIPRLQSTHFCKNPIASETGYFLKELKLNIIIMFMFMFEIKYYYYVYPAACHIDSIFCNADWERRLYRLVISAGLVISVNQDVFF